MTSISTSSLDQLLWPDDSNATFHDAELLNLTIDYVQATAEFTLSICVGDPSSDAEAIREARQTGILRVTGLEVLSIEPPDPRYRPAVRKALWIDADLESVASDSEVQPGDQTGNPIRFWVFVHDWNSFLRVTGKKVSFRWEDLPC